MAADATIPDLGVIDGVIDALIDAQRRIAAAQADEVKLLAAAVALTQAQNDREQTARSHNFRESDTVRPNRITDIPLRSMAAQVGSALRVPDRTVQRKLSDAVVLVDGFPATLTAWAAGEVSRGHVQVIVDAGSVLDDDARPVFEAAALEIARRETPGRLRPAVKVLANRLHPVPLAERHQEAARTRNVWVRDLDDGMAELIATLPAAIAHGIRDRLDQYARRTIDARGTGDARGSGDTDGDGLFPGEGPAQRPTDTRRIGEVRTDVFADLLLTGHATPEVTNDSIPEGEAIVAHVQVTVPVLTALGGDDQGTSNDPAQLIGKAPIDTATALRLAGTATGWDRVLTHPITGTVLAVDRYRPTDQLKRTLRVRDEHCRFPGCRMPTTRCDIDHTTAAQHDGPTELGNLAHLCRRHHTLKHHSAWRVRQTPDGTLHWTSPTGRTYPDTPARTLHFTSAPPPDAPPDDGPPQPAPF